ncbi:MAG: hypothetical protein JNK02_07920 [Planctomycetes bacterium]|nr:hypothetical protein [Planctomycetota bacterium]
MPQNQSRRRTSGTKWIPVAVLVVVVAGAALGTYALLNDGRMPWSAETRAQAQASEDRQGKRAYPRALRSIPAFTAVTHTDLFDAKGEPLVSWLDPERAKESGILDAKEVLGRVTKAPKNSGYVFTESDFLPKGSPASPTAAIPDGMVGVQVTASQVPSLRGLKANDRFALVAAADPYAGAVAPRGTPVPADVQRLAHEQKKFGGVTRRLVEGGIVIVPMPDAKSSSKDPAFVAVPIDQHADLLSALNNGLEITVLAESRNPNATVERLPDPAPPVPIETITIQNGEKKETIVLPPSAPATIPGGAGR